MDTNLIGQFRWLVGAHAREMRLNSRSFLILGRHSAHFLFRSITSFFVSIKPAEKCWLGTRAPDWFCEKLLACLSRNLIDSFRKFCIDDRAAMMAGEPKPCEINEKCVRLRWMFGSRMFWGRELHSGERSWLSRSTNSFTICLHRWEDGEER